MKNIPEKMKKAVILSSVLVFSGMSFQACDFFKKKEEKKDTEAVRIEEQLAASEKKLDEILAKVSDIQKNLAGKKPAETHQPEESQKNTGQKHAEESSGNPETEAKSHDAPSDRHIMESEKASSVHEPEKKTSGEKPADSPDIIYKKAVDAYRIKKFENAAMLFDQIISFFPGNDLVDNSLYWKGESLFALKKYNEAIESFIHLCEKYPDSEKAPASMLKTGYAYQSMNRHEEAMNYFRKTFVTYPFSQPGTIAQSMFEKNNNKRQ